jgi:hypothetical protein
MTSSGTTPIRHSNLLQVKAELASDLWSHKELRRAGVDECAHGDGFVRVIVGQSDICVNCFFGSHGTVTKRALCTFCHGATRFPPTAVRLAGLLDTDPARRHRVVTGAFARPREWYLRGRLSFGGF